MKYQVAFMFQWGTTAATEYGEWNFRLHTRDSVLQCTPWLAILLGQRLAGGWWTQMDATPTAATQVGRDDAEAKTKDGDEQRINGIASRYGLANVRYATENEKRGKQQIQDSHWAMKPMPTSIPTQPFSHCITENGKDHEDATKERVRIVDDGDRNDACDQEEHRDSEIDREEYGVNEQMCFGMRLRFDVHRRNVGRVLHREIITSDNVGNHWSGRLTFGLRKLASPAPCACDHCPSFG
ncbi:MAG: hypothetical protein AAF989_12890 [Planctomycetota bacterium]